MKLLDLCCKAGGASMGYHLAGFEVTGVDHDPQPHYPFTFVQADALEYLAAYGHEYDVIAGSPPCQFGSEATPLHLRSNHKNLIPLMRELMIATGKPYIIENVEGVKKQLRNPLMLCGTMFQLPIFRHRFFETNFDLAFAPAMCNHNFSPILITGMGQRRNAKGRRYKNTIVEKRQAIGIDWMTWDEITEAIPPAYTRWIGEQLLKQLSHAT